MGKKSARRPGGNSSGNASSGRLRGNTEEARRRQEVSALRGRLCPHVGDWWWARDESLEVSVVTGGTTLPAPPARPPGRARLNPLPQAFAGQLKSSNSHTVIDGFLGPEFAGRVRRELLMARREGMMAEAGSIVDGNVSPLGGTNFVQAVSVVVKAARARTRLIRASPTHPLTALLSSRTSPPTHPGEAG